MARRGNLWVISGPSGAGKGTLVARIIQALPDAWVSISATTRSPRSGEQNEVHYFFLNDAQFDDLVAHDGFLEWAHVHQARYGTPKSSVLEHIKSGDQVILEIDVQGAFQVKKAYPDAHLVFIAPPSLEVLEERLRHRGTETDEVIQARMQTAHRELELQSQYDVVFVNDDLEVTTQQILDYMNAAAQSEDE